MNWETILCLGDSITYGARSYLGFPEYCGAALTAATKRHWNVVNLAKSGYTTIDLHRHLDVIGATFYHCQPGVINILVGTNDLKAPTSLEDFEIAYQALLVKVRVAHPQARLMLNEIPPLWPGVRLPYTSAMNEQVIAFNAIINKIAQKMQVDVLTLEFEHDYMFDGVHLNSRGAKQVGQFLAQKILSLRE